MNITRVGINQGLRATVYSTLIVKKIITHYAQTPAVQKYLTGMPFCVLATRLDKIQEYPHTWSFRTKSRNC
jgi:hypothetical protein